MSRFANFLPVTCDVTVTQVTVTVTHVTHVTVTQSHVTYVTVTCHMF